MQSLCVHHWKVLLIPSSEAPIRRLVYSLSRMFISSYSKNPNLIRKKALKMSGTQEEEKKPMDQSTHINLELKGQYGDEVFFRIKHNTQLRKLMTAYCDCRYVDQNSFAFLFDGRRLYGELTPDELEMKDVDEIDAMLHHVGGNSGGL